MGRTLRYLLVGLLTLGVLAGLGDDWSVDAASAIPTILTDVTCPSISSCWALGGNSGEAFILSTVNAGKTWKTDRVFKGTGSTLAPFKMTCASTSHCWVLEYKVTCGHTSCLTTSAILATENSGASWRYETLPGAVKGVELEGISCVGDSLCWASGDSAAGDAVVIGTTNGGTTWRAEKVPKLVVAMGLIATISCASGDDCVVVASRAITTSNGGATWVLRKTPAKAEPLVAVSCDSTTCAATGSDGGAFPTAQILSSTNGGDSWTVRKTLSNAEASILGGVSCPSVTTCRAVGIESFSNGTSQAVVFTTSNRGTTWSLQKFDGIGLYGVSCALPSDCVAVGAGTSVGTDLVTDDGGTTWVVHKL
jgi:hypothetical protein